MMIFNSLTDPELITMLKNGAVGVIPTDTVYGLAAASHNQQAVARMYTLKKRERKPGTSIAASTAQLIALGLPESLVRRAAYLWPNPISVVMTHDLEHIHQGIGASPFRVVADRQLHKLLVQTGPLTTSSANHPGEPPATNLAEAQAYFGDQVDFYVDGGATPPNRPSSTVVGISEAGITVYREGAVTLDRKGTIL